MLVGCIRTHPGYQLIVVKQRQQDTKPYPVLDPYSLPGAAAPVYKQASFATGLAFQLHENKNAHQR
jgi:hypothetical protein